MGYLIPKFDLFEKVWFIFLTTYRHLMGYLIPTFDLFVKVCFGFSYP